MAHVFVAESIHGQEAEELFPLSRLSQMLAPPTPQVSAVTLPCSVNKAGIPAHEYSRLWAK